MDMPRVFSYRRFSSGRQARGHSLERQVASARLWCQEHGYELDEGLALADLGVSAYTGDNVSRGALSGFLTAINAGKVPSGSILLVESLDRLSRAALPEAVGLLTQIVRAGVRVVSLIDGKEWNQQTIEDTMSFMLSVILFSRAHEESSTKAKRVSAAFQRKRQAGLPVVSKMHGPGWVLPREDGSGRELDKAKSAAVQNVFQLAAKGNGGVAIARLANQAGWPLPWRVRKNSGEGWEHTAVSRLLRDRRVIGEWQPTRMVAGRLVRDGEPVVSYYPSAVSSELWHSVQSALKRRSGPKRIRGVMADIFSGLLYCSCGARMERKAASSRGSARYYCLARKAGRTTCQPVAEQVVLERVLSFIGQSQQEAFRSDAISSELQAKLAHAEAKATDAKERAANLVSVLESGAASTMLMQRLSTIEDELTQAEAEITDAREQLAALPLGDTSFGMDLAARASVCVSDKNAVVERHKLSATLNRVVQRIVWHGKFFMVHAKNGIGYGVITPPELLLRAKRKDAGIKRK